MDYFGGRAAYRTEWEDGWTWQRDLRYCLDSRLPPLSALLSLGRPSCHLRARQGHTAVVLSLLTVPSPPSHAWRTPGVGSVQPVVLAIPPDSTPSALVQGWQPYSGTAWPAWTGWTATGPGRTRPPIVPAAFSEPPPQKLLLHPW